MILFQTICSFEVNVNEVGSLSVSKCEYQHPRSRTSNATFRVGINWRNVVIPSNPDNQKMYLSILRRECLNLFFCSTTDGYKANFPDTVRVVGTGNVSKVNCTALTFDITDSSKKEMIVNIPATFISEVQGDYAKFAPHIHFGDLCKYKLLNSYYYKTSNFIAIGSFTCEKVHPFVWTFGYNKPTYIALGSIGAVIWVLFFVSAFIFFRKRRASLAAAIAQANAHTNANQVKSDVHVPLDDMKLVPVQVINPHVADPTQNLTPVYVRIGQ